MYRVARYRLALVREASIATTWDKTVRQSSDVAAFMRPLVADLDRETFWVLMLDGKNRVIGVNLVSVGSLTAALVHPREIGKALILSNSAAAILVHQHPSGDPTPSAEDLALTVHAHPTFAESLMEAAEVSLGRPIHVRGAAKR